MVEGRDGTNSNFPHKEKSSSVLISEISNLSLELRNVYSVRDQFPSGFLPYETKLEIRRINMLRDQKTVDLLLEHAANPNDRIQVFLQKYPGEKLHSFSMNKVSIFVPSTENPNQNYVVKTELTDLKRAGVAENSLQAEKLLGNPILSREKGVSFLHRTKTELLRIKQQIIDIKETGIRSVYSLEELENLTAEIIKDRIIPIINDSDLAPNSSLDFYLYEDREGKAISEETRLMLEGKLYRFETSGQKLLSVVSDLGGYDNIITCIS